MSQPASELLAQLYRKTLLLVEQTGAHRDDVDALVASAELDLKQAETAASAVSDADVAEVRHLLRGYVDRSAARADAARRLAASASDQHDAACRVLAALQCESPGHVYGKVVVVVDDYLDVREQIARVLRDAGFVVRTAANGLEGLIAAYEMRPGVIVMDVTMPVLDGIEATRLIKAAEATRDARVIAYTGDASAAVASHQQLFSAVIQKPAPPALVLATVQRVAGL